VRQYELEKSVRISGAFCMEQCQHGVSVCIDGAIHSVEDITVARELFGRLLLGEDGEQP
jgi:NADH:ubiquinone oxidoreductase subunit E